MSKLSKDAAVLELNGLREHLHTIVNSTVDALIANIENSDGDMRMGDSNSAETIYPLAIAPSLFKGKKATAVIFGDERVAVKAWRAVYTEILRRCIEDPDRHTALMSLRNKIAGRERVLLSDKPDGMDRPFKVAEALYAEGKFDTEWLLRILTREILDTVGYDYSNISVAVVSGWRRNR